MNCSTKYVKYVGIVYGDHCGYTPVRNSQQSLDRAFVAWEHGPEYYKALIRATEHMDARTRELKDKHAREAMEENRITPSDEQQARADFARDLDSVRAEHRGKAQCDDLRTARMIRDLIVLVNQEYGDKMDSLIRFGTVDRF